MMLLCQRRKWFHLAAFCVTVCVFCLIADEMCASEIRSDERVIFFPTLARLSDDGAEWIVPVHGWIFEPEENDLLRGAGVNWAADALELPPDSEDNARFRSRIRWFLVDNERGKEIVIDIAGYEHELSPSTPAGHFSDEIRVPVDVVTEHADEGWLEFRAVVEDDDDREFIGQIRLLDREGTIVISDIDDTVKITEVTDHRRLLARTFLEPFEAVSGMADVYQRWETEGAAIHFVSNGPWQFFPELQEFFEDASFPRATWSMRNFRLKERTGVEFLLGGDSHKLAEITRCLREYPDRTFILVGDTGERDPEIYATVASEFPEQVRLILLHNVTGESNDSPRLQEALRGLALDRWILFDDAEILVDMHIE